MVVLAMLPQVAGAGLFDILDEKYISDISELPYSPGNPAMSWQEQQHIKGWVDIVGWKNLSKENGAYYILGDPANLAIVAGNAEGTQPGILDSITKTVSISQAGSNLTAVLNVVLKWHTVYCDDKGCFINGRFTETAAFQDIEVIPEQFNNVFSPRVNITEYNNSIEPKLSIQITNTNSSRISISYGNKSAIHDSKIYHVEQTEKGIYYANASDVEAWHLQGQGIARFANSIILNTNISTLNYSQLDIRISNLYGSVKVGPSEFNITRVTYIPENVVYNPVLFAFLGIFMTLTGSAFYLIRQVTL